MKFILTVLSCELRVTKLHSLKIDTHLTSQLLSLIFTNIFLPSNLSSDEGKDIFDIWCYTRNFGHEKLEDISKFKDFK